MRYFKTKNIQKEESKAKVRESKFEKQLKVEIKSKTLSQERIYP